MCLLGGHTRKALRKISSPGSQATRHSTRLPSVRHRVVRDDVVAVAVAVVVFVVVVAVVVVVVVV